MCEGWSAEVLAPKLGVSVLSVRRWRQQFRPLILRRRHEQIAALFEELAGRPRDDRLTKALARREGYVPPLAWEPDAIDDPDVEPYTDSAGEAGEFVDPVLVDRVLDGTRPCADLNQAERVELWRRWHRQWVSSGHSTSGTSAFGRQFGISTDSAFRLRREAQTTTTPTAAKSA